MPVSAGNSFKKKRLQAGVADFGVTGSHRFVILKDIPLSCRLRLRRSMISIYKTLVEIETSAPQ